MKYNPKINEWAARLPGFAALHPLAPDALAQGTLELMWELEQWLVEISGMRAVTLQPAAGAHGELTGILMIRAYHLSRGDTERVEVIVPDSSHGTNPATASMAGFKTVTVKSTRGGHIDLAGAARGARAAHGGADADQPVDARPVRDADRGGARRRPRRRRAGLHGRREHERDPGQVQARPGRLRRHALQHAQDVLDAARRWRAGRRPGRGQRQARAVPALAAGPAGRGGEDAFRLERTGERPSSIGRVRSYQGSVGVLVRAYAYLLAHGGSGLEQVSEDAVLAANYLRTASPARTRCRSNGCASTSSSRRRSRSSSETGVRMLDIAKRLIDYGYHPPTIYFPLTVEEGMLVEPTETEIARDARRLRRRADHDRRGGACATRDASRRRRTTRPCGGLTRPLPRAILTCAGGR